MATSSITKNFIISGQKQVEMFADAIEASANDRTPRVPINVTYLQGADDIIKFMEKTNMKSVFCAGAGIQNVLFFLNDGCLSLPLYDQHPAVQR